MIKRGKLLWVIFLGLLLTTTIAGGYMLLYPSPYHFGVIVPGVLYRSGTLSSRGLNVVYKRIKLKTIIDLRSQQELNDNEDGWYTIERKFAVSHGVKIYHLKMLNNIPPTPKMIKRFITIMKNSANFPALIHCEMGVDRTGMMAAVYRMVFLHQNKFNVLKRLPMFGHNWKDKEKARHFILTFNAHKYQKG